jgi:hypothetical protein
MKKVNKIAIGSIATLLLTTSLVSAQTTIGGDMRLGIKSTSSNNKGASDTLMTKESQINFRNIGNLNFGGGKYEAGFSLEMDGTEGSGRSETASNLTAGAHLENNYINFIFGNTMFHIGSDHLKPSNVFLSEIVNGPQVIQQTVSLAGSSNGATRTASLARGIFAGEKGDGGKGIGVGFRQTLPNFGAISAVYHPNGDDNTQSHDTGDVAPATAGADADQNNNSYYSVGFRGGFGVKGLDLHVATNRQEAALPGLANFTATREGRTVGAQYNIGQITVGLDVTQEEYNATGSERKQKGLGIAYAVDKDLTVQFNHYRVTDTSPGAPETEKINGITIGQSLGPVGLTITAGRIDSAAGVAGRDGKAVAANLGIRF